MNYEEWMQEAKEEAKRNVVRKALDHLRMGREEPPYSLYLTFKTCVEGVQICPSLYKKYPKDISIVLQDEFWNLTVSEDSFAVDLLFDQTKQSIKVPFTALISFIDEKRGFLLELDPVEAPCIKLPDNVILFRKSPSSSL